MMMESALTRAIMQALTQRRCFVVKLHGGARQVAGLPDLLVVAPGGRVIFIEVKRAGGRLTALQARQIERLRQCGAEVYVVDNVDDATRIVSRGNRECQ